MVSGQRLRSRSSCCVTQGADDSNHDHDGGCVVVQFPEAQAQARREAEEMADLPGWNTSYSILSPLVVAYDARKSAPGLQRIGRGESVRAESA
jgi:hypothetical protein